MKKALRRAIHTLDLLIEHAEEIRKECDRLGKALTNVWVPSPTASCPDRANISTQCSSKPKQFQIRETLPPHANAFPRLSRQAKILRRSRTNSRQPYARLNKKRRRAGREQKRKLRRMMFLVCSTNIMYVPVPHHSSNTVIQGTTYSPDPKATENTCQIARNLERKLID